MAENVQCCYCQNLEIRIDEDRVPFDWCEKVVDSPDPQRARECEYYEKIVPPAAKPFGNGVDVCPVCGKPSTIGRPQSNADSIRSMTDEGLADWIADILNHCDNKKPEDECLESCPLYACCNLPFDNIENWLKSPWEGEQP